MDVTPLVAANAQIIQSYAGGKFKISGKIYEGPVLVDPDSVQPWDNASLATIPDRYDVLLIGAGAPLSPTLNEMRRSVLAHRIQADVMDTGAACRTYNVLLSEGRRVVAALLPYLNS